MPSEVSTVQDPPVGSASGSGLDFPDWFTIRKQPFDLPHAGSLNVFMYWARSDTAVGSLYAVTTAIVWPAAPVAGSE